MFVLAHKAHRGAEQAVSFDPMTAVESAWFADQRGDVIERGFGILFLSSSDTAPVSFYRVL